MRGSFPRVTIAMADIEPEILEVRAALDLAIDAPLREETRQALTEIWAKELRRLGQADLEEERDYTRREIRERAAEDLVETDILAGRLAMLEAELTRRAHWDALSDPAPRHLTSDFAHELKGRLRLHEFLEARYGLVFKGRHELYLGRCPLHHDDTPSFAVYYDARFVCFGCGARGDVYEFVCQIGDAAGFRQAVELVAGYLGVRLPAAHPALWETHDT